ncbi:MAG: tetratricopeptide repeat protein, partial [Bacteroidota bacterium]
FCLAISFLLIKLSTKDMNKPKFTNLEQMVSMNAVLFGIIFIVIASFSFKTLARSKDWKDNITLFRHDVKVIDKSARAHYNYGTALFVDIFPKEDNINQKAIILDSAVREYVQALNIFPAYPDAYRNLARCYDLRTEWNNEITTYEMLLKYDRKPDTTVFMNLGILYTKVKEFDKSLSYLDSVIKYNPKIAKAYKNKAFNYLNKKMPNEAIVESMKALELDPNYEKPLSYLGCAYMNLQQYPKAIEYLNKAIEIEPSDVENLKFLATVYSNMGDNKKALELMDKVKSMTGQ